MPVRRNKTVKKTTKRKHVHTRSKAQRIQTKLREIKKLFLEASKLAENKATAQVFIREAKRVKKTIPLIRDVV